MKKPSEKILEICADLVIEHGKNCKVCEVEHHTPRTSDMFKDALVQYLDEEYEKKTDRLRRMCEVDGSTPSKN